MNPFPTTLTAREACAAALGALVHGAGPLEAAAIVRPAGVEVKHTTGPSGTAHTIELRLSARRHYEATAGCQTDAFTNALREALGKGEGE